MPAPIPDLGALRNAPGDIQPGPLDIKVMISMDILTRTGDDETVRPLRAAAATYLLDALYGGGVK